MNTQKLLSNLKAFEGRSEEGTTAQFVGIIRQTWLIKTFWREVDPSLSGAQRALRAKVLQERLEALSKGFRSDELSPILPSATLPFRRARSEILDAIQCLEGMLGN